MLKSKTCSRLRDNGMAQSFTTPGLFTKSNKQKKIRRYELAFNLELLLYFIVFFLISLQSRRFLTKTRRYTDRGRHLEKQRKTHQPLP